MQTALASSKLRTLYCRGFEDGAQRLVLNAGNGLYTTALVNTHPAPKGMIVLLHGWLGHPQSTYTVSAAKTLFDAGFSTVRMTLPEHGEAVMLNRDPVPITRHDFLREAMRELAARTPDLDIGLMGFSLGGNMALRIARDLGHEPIAQLKHVFAVSPAIDPESTAATIDKHPVFRRYFMRKMARLYREKLTAFPELEYLSQILQEKTALGVTKAFIDHMPDYADLQDYFDAYRIRPDDFVDGATKVTLLTSDDDPIVSPAPAHALKDGPMFERIFTRHGGHNGFFERFPRTVISEVLALERFRQSLAAE